MVLNRVKKKSSLNIVHTFKEKVFVAFLCWLPARSLENKVNNSIIENANVLTCASCKEAYLADMQLYVYVRMYVWGEKKNP